MLRFFLTAFIIIDLDQYVKFLIKTTMNLYQSITVIPNIFSITYIENFGIAFGLTGQGINPLKRWLLCFIIFMATVMIVVYWFKFNKKKWLFDISLGLILGGAIGNLVDRVLYGSVTDFLEVGYKSFVWPVFNIADSAVSVGVTLFIFYLLFTKEDKAIGQSEEKNASDII